MFDESPPRQAMLEVQALCNYESCHLGSGYTTCLVEETPQAKCYSVLDVLFQDTFQL